MNPAEILHLASGCMHEFTLSHGLFLSLFVAGLVGGFTHCAAMCGPFVLSQSKNLTKLSGYALMPYHLGRITTYTVLAVLLSSVLNLAFLFMPVRGFVVAPILMVAGLIFFVTAFPGLLKIFPWAGMTGFSLPYKFFNFYHLKLSKVDGVLGRYLLGVLLGFMPCGLIVSALMASATSASPVHAAMAMISFGLGTVPALVLVSYAGGALKQKYPSAMQKISKGAMVWSGFWLFAMAGFLLI